MSYTTYEALNDPSEEIRRLRKESPDMLFRLKTGKAPFIITCEPKHYSRIVQVRYCKSGILSIQSLCNIIPYHTDSETQERTSDMKTLYEITLDGKTVFGHKLAVNSNGNWVMELHDKTIHVCDKADCEEVLPYTVSVKFDDRGKGYSFFAKKGEVKVGDVLWLSSHQAMVEVIDINTKSRQASKWLTGIKVAGTPLTAGE